jgi:hypothetical protein
MDFGAAHKRFRNGGPSVLSPLGRRAWTGGNLFSRGADHHSIIT